MMDFSIPVHLYRKAQRFKGLKKLKVPTEPIDCTFQPSYNSSSVLHNISLEEIFGSISPSSPLSSGLNFVIASEALL